MATNQSKSKIIFMNTLDSRDMDELKLLILPHPKDGSPISFLSNSINIYELQSIQPRKYSSWFINQRVISQNGYLMATRFDICYLCLPAIKRAGSRYSPIEQILAPMNAYDQLPMSPVQYKMLGNICDVNDELGDEMILYRYNEEKTMSWLKRRIDATAHMIAKKRVEQSAAKESASSKNFDLRHQAKDVAVTHAHAPSHITSIEVNDEDRVMAMKIIADYVDDELIGKLLVSYGVNASAMQSKTSSVKRKADWELELEIEKDTVAYTHQAAKSSSSTASSTSTATSSANKQPTASAKKATPSSKVAKPIQGVQSITSFFGKK